jgi:phenylpyruvate tautomerase PptA (4-oxalocrotonate tautomerase family)
MAGQVADHEADGGRRYFQPGSQLAHRQRAVVLQVGQQGEVPRGEVQPAQDSRPEARLAGRELALITALTEAVVLVYGEWARDLVVVHLDGVPAGRWAVGGRTTDDAAPAITLGIREAALARPGGSEIAARLVAGLTDAAVGVLGEETRGGTSVELVATPQGRAGRGGAISE